MAETVHSYQCPACTAPLHFSAESGKLECEYCGSSYEVEEIDKLNREKEAEAAAALREEEKAGAVEWESNGEEWGQEGETLRAYNCPSCGAQLFCEESNAATSCPYCGNPSVIPGKLDGSWKPDYVIPFKRSKEEAVAALEKFYKGKFLLPKAFRNHHHLEEIQGVYVPFWLFDGEAEVDMKFHAMNNFTHREGDYLVTEHRHYAVSRAGKIAFSRVSVDGSSKMPDNLMDSIEPFDYGELQPFSTAFLPGFLADRYDVDAKSAGERADLRCKNTARDAVRRSVYGYQLVTPCGESLCLHRGKVQYALLPVWLLSTRWEDQSYLFAMNGQSGKLVGDLPIDQKKLNRCFWGAVVGASLLMSLLFANPLARFFAGLLA